ncbi:MAG: ABC transporter permease [Clostridia bacterium]|nr:ABC transporter permease [Clostridia bacterium]
MKRKLTINTLAMGNLKQRRKQYTILIIGIILAMVFSSGVMFFISCTKSSNEEYKRRSMGNFYGYYFACEDFVDVEQGVKDGLVESYGYAHILGYAYTDEEKMDKGTSVAWLDEEAKDLYYVHLTEGKYPEAKGEIAIEKDAALRLGIKPELGKEISVSMLTANYKNFLNTSTDKTYTIVGIMTDKRKNFEKWEGVDRVPEFPAALVSNEETVDLGGKEIPAVFFNPTEKSLKEQVPDPNSGTDGTIYYSDSFFVNFLYPIYNKADAIYGKHHDNRNIMYNVRDLSADSNGDVMNSALLSITLAVVLTIASCIGIINAFTTNLKERKKQIGMLRAVGATKRQIINIFGREAFVISLICAPISVVISYLGVKLYAKLMGDGFIFMPDYSALIISALVSVVCVMLAALIPLISASNISPMQAIRNVELSRKMKRKKIKTQKSFIVPKLLANRSLKFYRGRQISVSIILIVTIFASSFGFAYLKADYENYSWNRFNTSDYVISRSDYPDKDTRLNMPNIDKKINANDIRDFLDYPMFKSTYGYKEAQTTLVCNKPSDYINLVSLQMDGDFRFEESNYEMQTKENLQNAQTVDEMLKIWYKGEGEFYQKLKQNTASSSELIGMEIQGYDPIMIENNIDHFKIIDGKINIDKLESGEEIILVAYNEAVLEITWDTKHNRVYSYGVRDSDIPYERNYIKNTEEFLSVSAKNNYKVGDTINLRTVYSDSLDFNWDDGKLTYLNADKLTVYDKEVKIGAIVKPFNFSETMMNHSKFGVVTTSTGMDIVTGRHHDYEELNLVYDGELSDEADLEATEYLNSILSGGYYRVRSGYSFNKDSQQTSKILMISLLSIVILMFSICASIVNNALTAKIRESKKEIGTLRAVGASVKELTSAYIRQLVSMFAWGMGIGLGGYTLTHTVLVLYYGKEVYSIPFMIWPAMIICVLLCLICSVNLYAKIKQEMKHSIVENIREL